MTRTLAEFLLRLYPRAWRMRYEEEVRALMDDCAPGWRDVAGFVRGASVEWAHSVVDPLEHPVLSGVLRGLGPLCVVIGVIFLTANPIGVLLQRIAGPPPDWIGTLAGLVMIIAMLRGAAAQPSLERVPIGVHGRTLSFGPMSAVQVRAWWAILWTCMVFGAWAGDPWLGSWGTWFLAPMYLTSATRAGWNRMQAQQELWRLRRELRWATREHLRLQTLAARHLTISPDLEASASDIARLNQAVRVAAEAVRTAQPIAKLESNQTCR